MTGYLKESGVAVSKMGNVTSGEIKIDNADWGNISEWKNKYDNAIGKIMNKNIAAV